MTAFDCSFDHFTKLSSAPLNRQEVRKPLQTMAKSKTCAAARVRNRLHDHGSCRAEADATVEPVRRKNIFGTGCLRMALSPLHTGERSASAGVGGWAGARRSTPSLSRTLTAHASAGLSAEGAVDHASVASRRPVGETSRRYCVEMDRPWQFDQRPGAVVSNVNCRRRHFRCAAPISSGGAGASP